MFLSSCWVLFTFLKNTPYHGQEKIVTSLQEHRKAEIRNRKRKGCEIQKILFFTTKIVKINILLSPTPFCPSIFPGTTNSKFAIFIPPQKNENQHCTFSSCRYISVFQCLINSNPCLNTKQFYNIFGNVESSFINKA